MMEYIKIDVLASRDDVVCRGTLAGDRLYQGGLANYEIRFDISSWVIR